jgi:hypothetical protein
MPKALSAREQEIIMTSVKADSSHNDRYRENVNLCGVRLSISDRWDYVARKRESNCNAGLE